MRNLIAKAIFLIVLASLVFVGGWSMFAAPADMVVHHGHD